MTALACVATFSSLVLALCAGNLYVAANPDRFVSVFHGVSGRMPLTTACVVGVSMLLLLAGVIGICQGFDLSHSTAWAFLPAYFGLLIAPGVVHDRRLAQGRKATSVDA